MAHNEFGVLQRLISLLDAPESDFYVHIDRKVRTLPELSAGLGRLFVLEERADVRWGTVSQLKAELLLLDVAQKRGPYAHYHILSGTHLPLKPIEELLPFYESHADEEILRLWTPDPGDADFKLRRYHFPIRDFKSPNPVLRWLCQHIWTAVIGVQKLLGIRHLKKETFYKADQWASVSETACRFLTEHRKEMLRKYRLAFCPDEYFLATELKKAGRFSICDCPQLLYVQFEKESPRSFPLSEYPVLQKTGCLWGRKFTESA